MTSGRRPGLLAAVLVRGRPWRTRSSSPSRPNARRRPRGRGRPRRRRALVPGHSPADRPIAWLFRSCAGRWILNVDDDEVPSPRLVDALPGLLERRDVTHAWIARRWLHPTRDTYVASPPWGTEFQLRLVLADERFLQFSDDFHRARRATGRGRPRRRAAVAPRHGAESGGESPAGARRRAEGAWDAIRRARAQHRSLCPRALPGSRAGRRPGRLEPRSRPRSQTGRAWRAI